MNEYYTQDEPGTTECQIYLFQSVRTTQIWLRVIAAYIPIKTLWFSGWRKTKYKTIKKLIHDRKQLTLMWKRESPGTFDDLNFDQFKPVSEKWKV